MITRREAVKRLGAAAGAGLLEGSGALRLLERATGKDESAPMLAPGAPTSTQRMALIEAFKRDSEGLETKFAARTHPGDGAMPYRLFRPEAAGRLPLVVYLHGSGGLGDDNVKQLGLGNIFGTRLWLLPENQKRFPCYVVVPQTDQGWANYDLSHESTGSARVLPGLGDGSRRALEVVDSLCKELAIDERRIYVAGQSMGGAGVWNMITQRPAFFAAAVICCGSVSTEDGTESLATPVWNFHGAADQTVPVSLSRERMAARRKAGGHPIYTEYAGVDHNVWQWAFTEPELVKWVFAQRRG